MKFQVYPEHCNFYQTEDGKLMMHGAEILKIADRQSAILCREFLKDTGLIPLTVGADKCMFLYGPSLGDILEVSTEMESVGTRRMTVRCNVYGEKGKCFTGLFSFCSFVNENGKYTLSPHNLDGPVR